jgi:HemY protein
MSAPRRVEPPREAPADVTVEKARVVPEESAPAAQESRQESRQENTQESIQANPQGNAEHNAQDNVPANSTTPAAASEPVPSPPPPPTLPPSPEASSPAAAPLFRPRNDLRKRGVASVPPVIPIIRAPDDPGIDEDGRDEFAEPHNPPQGQAGGWRGFLSRWGG